MSRKDQRIRFRWRCIEWRGFHWRKDEFPDGNVYRLWLGWVLATWMVQA